MKVTEWYREGIGWVYETNREKVREAEDELTSFYNQDNIDDLNNAKDAELENLNQRIKNWEDYLAMLNEKYNEYNVLQEQRLLMELIGVDSQKEVYEYIKSDMTAFTEYVEANTASFLESQSAAYLAFNSSFNTFLDEYSVNLRKLQELNELKLSLMSAEDYLGMNDGKGGFGFGGEIFLDTDIPEFTDKQINAMAIAHNVDLGVAKDMLIANWRNGYERYGFDGSTREPSSNSAHSNYDSGDDYMQSQGGMSQSDVDELAQAGQDWLDAYKRGDTEGMEAAHERAESIREEHGYSGGADGSEYNTLSYSSGLEGGPVTYTGLAMLHGSPNEPEYVLNNDQAYNLLRYMATKRVEFESTTSKDTGTQYIVQGNVVLEGVDNPQEFWNEVTRAMGNRWNVTKNR